MMPKNSLKSKFRFEHLSTSSTEEYIKNMKEMVLEDSYAVRREIVEEVDISRESINLIWKFLASFAPILGSPWYR